jgi:hypothetical protein
MTYRSAHPAQTVELKQQAGLQSFRVRLGISTATLLRHEAIELLEPILVHPPMLPLVHRARAAS